jgi:hypothetical protein
MKIAYVIVTYKQPEDLAQLYASITATDSSATDADIYIINNHTSFTAPAGAVHVLHNQGRPNESLGNLAQSWNFGLAHALGNSVNPKYEWVALCQCDVRFVGGWKAEFARHVNERNLLLAAVAPGDQVTFIHVDAFRRVGWWDERFCGIGYHEFDFFVRAYLWLGPQAAIEGHGWQLQWNWPEGLQVIARHSDDGVGHSNAVNPMLYRHLYRKWGDDVLRALVDPQATESVGPWTLQLDQIYGDWEQRSSGVVNRPLPKEYNWHPHLYRGDSSSYEHLYDGYVALK